MAAVLAYPGDIFPVASTSSIKLGPGLAVESNDAEKASSGGSQHQLVATATGHYGHVQDGKGRSKSKAKESARGEASSSSSSVWIESNNSRFIPSAHDHVICQITARGAEAYQVTLMNAYAPANLPALSFEGATKRNKPNLRVGTLLYAQVVSASRHTEVELTCIDAATGKSGGFGELKTERTPDTTLGTATSSTKQADAVAMLWPVSCGLARSLLLPSHQLLSRLAAHFPFEVAIGVNGFIWVRGHNARHVVAIGAVLARADQEAWLGSASSNDTDAMTVAKERGLLSTADIARIVEPFK